MNRRELLRLATGCLALGSPAFLAAGPALAQPTTADMIFGDPEVPVGGNPDGDITIVAYVDYNCPFCKESAPELARVVAEDGNIRLLYKDWPILTPASVYGARLALAAHRQGRYRTVHDALMAIPGRGVDEATMLAAVRATNVDAGRLDADLAADGAAIDALIARNNDQAEALGMRGTPTYLIGPFIAMGLDYDGFRQAVADAREASAAEAAR